jgi:hypothetical protein
LIINVNQKSLFRRGPPLQRTPTTRHGEQALGKLCNSQALKPDRRGDRSPEFAAF